MPPSSLLSTYILGCRLDRVTWPNIEAFCKEALAGHQPRHIVTLNGEHILAAQDDLNYKEIVNQADLNIPDSTNVVWVSRLKGSGLKQVTPGSDLTLKLAEWAAEMQKSIYLLGGREEIPERAAQELRKNYPNLKIAGTSSKDPDDTSAVQDIKDSGADVVLVAYGAPKHEYWISRNADATGAKILVGIGGTFDMLAGTLPRAPRFIRALHLEWLWRLILQPSRIGRIWRAVVVFPFKALLAG